MARSTALRARPLDLPGSDVRLVSNDVRLNSNHPTSIPVAGVPHVDFVIDDPFGPPMAR
jgi:hypothetical protein